MEILAPVGDNETLTAAINSGADAVYFGLDNFNARRNARNFTDDEIKSALSLCRTSGVKAHIVLNTLLFDGEIDKAMKAAKKLILLGADTFIVQDAGLALLLKSNFPHITLHASTQMTVHSKGGILNAKKMGFDRVVLSRELSLNEITLLTEYANTLGIETEVFVHGALCMCMSGQCFLSSVIGSRSGNRGLCAQPCRLPFKTPEGYEYSLSLKDMSHLSFIGELIKAGVSSFKIEGRMKDPEYVAAAVTATREARDNGQISEPTKTLLTSIFSRSGFCDGYITGKRDNMFGIRTKEDTLLTKEVQNSVHNLYRHKFSRIPLSFKLICKKSHPAYLLAHCKDFSAEISGETVTESINRPLTQEFAKQKLSKLGSTVFFLDSFECEIEEGAYLSISALNQMKGQAVEMLNSKLDSFTPLDDTGFSPSPSPKKSGSDGLKIRARFNGVLPDDISNISRIYLTHTSPDELFIKAINSNIETGVELPRVFFSGTDVLKQRLSHLKALGVKYALCEGYEGIDIAKELSFECDLGAFSQITNSYSCLNAEKRGINSITLSFECSIEQINSISTSIDTGFIGYGYLPLMITRCCPLKNSRDCKDCKGDYLTDRKDKQFFVKCRDGVSELFNCVPLEMCNKQEQFLTDFVLLYFTHESKEEIGKEIADWKNKKSLRQEFTHGLYYRGVL